MFKAQNLQRLIAWGLMSCLAMLVHVGCSRQAAHELPRTGSFSADYGSGIGEEETPSVDVGVVLKGSDWYCCIPLDRIELSPKERITAMVSSCDCLKPEIVEYTAPSGFPEQGVLVRYVSPPSVSSRTLLDGFDGNEQPNEMASQSLMVAIDMVLAEDRTHRFFVNLLITSLE